MERLNAKDGLDAPKGRQLSEPKGTIAPEKLDWSADALEKFQTLSRAIEKGDRVFQGARLSADFEIFVNHCEHDLIASALCYGVAVRDFWNVYYLDGGEDDCLSEKVVKLAVKDGSGRDLAGLLENSYYYEWDQQRTKWLLQEINGQLADSFKETLALYDETAQETAWETLDVWKLGDIRQLNEMKLAVNAVLDAETKAEIGNNLCPRDYFDNSPCMRADLATFIAIMEASLAE